MGYQKEVQERDLRLIQEGWYSGKLLEIKPKTVGQGVKLVWKWEILEGEYTGKYAWGECWDNLDQGDGCEWRRWHEALVERPIEIGENIDTDQVINMMAQIYVSHRTYTPKGQTEERTVAEVSGPESVQPMSSSLPGSSDDPWAKASVGATNGGWSSEPPF